MKTGSKARIVVNATPAKLKSGDWGAKVQGTVTVGDIVTITTKAGKTWQARIARVIWTGDGISICATESMDRPAYRARFGVDYCGYRCHVRGHRCTAYNPCHDCE